MLPTTVVRFKCSFALQGCTAGWLLFSSLGSFHHSKAFDETVVAGRAEGPEAGNEAHGWTSTCLPSFLLSSAAPHTPSPLQGQRPPTASDDSRSPGPPPLEGGDGPRQTQEGDESSLTGDSVAWETTRSYSQEGGEVLSLAPPSLPPERRSPARWSRKLKRESKNGTSTALVSVLTAATLLGALLVYRKSRQSGENPSGRGSSFSAWLVGSGVSQRRRVGAILLAGVTLIVAALLAIYFAGTEGPNVRADGEITSSTTKEATAPPGSPVSPTTRLVEIEKSVREVRSNAPVSAVVVALAVMALSFLAMRLSQVRRQTEDVGEEDLRQIAGEAESANRGKRQEDYEDADGAKTSAEEAEMKAGQTDKLKDPDVPSKAQWEEESGTDTAGGQEAQKAPESFTPDEVPPPFDYGPIFRAMTDDLSAQTRSGRYQEKEQFQLSDYPSAETEARRQIGKLKAAIANISPDLYKELERQLGILQEPCDAPEDLQERFAHLTLLSRMVQMAVVQKNLSAMEEGLLQRRFHGQLMEFSRHVGGQEAILRHIRAALADDGFAFQQARGLSGDGGMSALLEELARVLGKKAEVLLEAVDFTGGSRSDSEEFRRTLQVVNNGISRAKHQLSELKPTAL